MLWRGGVREPGELPGADGVHWGAYLYLSRASSMTDCASRTRDCTPLRRPVSTFWARKALTLACSSRQTWRKERDGAVDAGSDADAGAAGGSLTPPFAVGATPLARWWCGIATAAVCAA